MDSKETQPAHVEVSDHAHASPDPSMAEASVVRTLLDNPKIVALSLFANLGAVMYGFDNLALSLCLSMVPFQLVYS
jgi:MFS transporter, SP family, general alpha glucoside:H+ symporter